jgi:hypothetical protein
MRKKENISLFLTATKTKSPEQRKKLSVTLLFA